MTSFHTEEVTGYHIDSDHPGLYSCGTSMVDLFFLHPMYIVAWAIVFSPIMIPIVKGMYDIAFNIPQYFKDLKDSRNKKTCGILREELRKEVEKQMHYSIECRDLQIETLLKKIEKLTKEKNNIKWKLEKIESWIYKRQSEIKDADAKKYRASKEMESFISRYNYQTFGDIT